LRFLLFTNKISGVVLDKKIYQLYANIVFKGSNEGIVTDENGRFYMESQTTYNAIVIAFAGYSIKEVEHKTSKLT
jgi:hypothetical protein